VDRQIEELLRDGIIKPSKSPYNSPVWVVPKKPKPNGEKQYRMVIDFKRLNAVTIADTYPIPDINSILASLGKAKYFTTLDLTSGFHQIYMLESDIPKTAFSTSSSSVWIEKCSSSISKNDRRCIKGTHWQDLLCGHRRHNSL